METIRVLSLPAEKMDCCEEKNAFIRKSFTELKKNESGAAPRMLFLNSGKLAENRVLELLEKDELFSYADVIAFCTGEAQDAVQLSFEDVLQCFSLQIAGLAFSGELLAKAGNYNEKLQALSDYELLCRLAENAGDCLFVFPGLAEDELQVTKEELSGYAYLLRRYSQRLQQQGTLEDVLQQMYRVAENGGMLSEFQAYFNRMFTSPEAYEEIAAATAPFLIFHGDNTCYGTLQDFACSLAEQLCRMGQAVVLVKAGELDYESLRKGIYKGIIGFQSKAIGNEFFQVLHGPKLQFWLDNPAFYQSFFQQLQDDCYILCHDADYICFMKEQYHIQNVIQMPPAGHDSFGGSGAALTGADRPYDIVYIGTYYPAAEELLEGIGRDYYEYMSAHPKLTFAQGLKALLTEQGLEMESEALADNLTMLKPICQRVINEYKRKVIDIILEAGYEIHVYGDSWGKYDSPLAHRLIRHPQVTVEESLLEWQKAKIGLNIMSWHKSGMTERVANIMLSGAACLSDETNYLTTHFTDGESIVCFSPDHPEELPDRIAQLLEKDRYADIARKGYEIAAREHTWERRAEEILKLVSHTL